MPKAVLNPSTSVVLACGKAVEKAGKAMAQTFKLITESTTSRLNISQNLKLMRFLGAAFAQLILVFTQSKMGVFNLVGGQLYSFSAVPINTTKLIKDF